MSLSSSFGNEGIISFLLAEYLHIERGPVALLVPYSAHNSSGPSICIP